MEEIMNMQSSPTTIALILVLGLMVAPAHAQQARSFVSGLGSDTNAPNCTRTAPCRTFQTAHDNTLANGEITVLDPGSYGGVTITKNISVINDGVGEAGILVSGGNAGIFVNAPGAAVTLRGLTIKGIGFGGGDGIAVGAAAALNVENCTIRNLDGSGLLGMGLFVQATSLTLQVANAVITDNSAIGIFISPAGTANVTAVLDYVGLHNNRAGGLVADGTGASGGKLAVTVNDSVASNNGALSLGSAGFFAGSDPGKALTDMMVNRSVAANNPSNGIVASGAAVGVSASVIFNNASGWTGTIVSAGNNVVQGNASNEGAMPTFPLR
jgi:hypothetical protein